MLGRAMAEWADLVPGLLEQLDPALAPAALLRLGAALQLSLRGSVCLYQGEELGLPQAKVSFEDLKDPEAIYK